MPFSSVKPKRKIYIIPDLNGVVLLEYFLVAAVSSLFVIRGFLALTGYPQIGGGGLHIAHMLWGGLLMLAAIFTLLGTLNAQIKVFAAILGGVGFGTFIDELGKFITADNNYFYQPAVALIYVIFMSIFLVIRWLSNRLKYAPTTYAVNVVEVFKEIIMDDFNEDEKNKALKYYDHVDKSDLRLEGLFKLIVNAKPIQANFSGYKRVKLIFAKWYETILHKRFMGRIILGFFILSAIFNLAVAALVIGTVGKSGLMFTVWGYLASVLTVGILTMGGIYFYARKQRLRAYRVLQIAALVSILLTQFFLFIQNQFQALINLSLYISAYVLLRWLISAEISEKESKK